MLAVVYQLRIVVIKYWLVGMWVWNDTMAEVMMALFVKLIIICQTLFTYIGNQPFYHCVGMVATEDPVGLLCVIIGIVTWTGS